MLPNSIKQLINQFSKLPSVGPRQAARFVFHLIKQPKAEIEEFAKDLISVSKNLKQCSSCFRIIDVEGLASHICDICNNEKRNRSIICIIEKDTDIETIEKTDRYNGLYHVLGDNNEAKLKELVKRVKNEKKGIKEVIIATSATTSGDTIALYIARLLKPLQIKTTRLGRGLSTGSELEYMDEETLSQALLGRK